MECFGRTKLILLQGQNLDFDNFPVYPNLFPKDDEKMCNDIAALSWKTDKRGDVLYLRKQHWPVGYCSLVPDLHPENRQL